MSFEMPPVKQVPSPNYSARSASVRLIIVHDTEGSYAGAVAWFAQTRSEVSAHLVMSEDGSEVTQMVPLSAKAWHAVALNSASIGIEGAGVEAQGFSNAWWQSMSEIVAWLLRAYGLECRWAEGGQGEGFCSHHDLGAAGGGHVDPVAVGSSAWLRFVDYVKEAYAAFGTGPLPPFALHGAPGPHEIVAPPDVPPEPSHGGVPRNDPPAAPAAFPDGNDAVAWTKALQTFINAHGDAQVAVDGDWGVKSRNALSALLLAAVNLDMKR